ncbi:mitochondrial exoribonuclease [Niveomyces insectorum RCEF 264]|uniref:Mitochondrial exoribonuclease n=1 Tax=Niveomyces insectorum RCEF 264 TaxID=1081102 RepID=A0A167X2A4_9HYPO|nr:mitochondrial exoribonuclease [Niveomyces insectorum RCEF 264]
MRTPVALSSSSSSSSSSSQSVQRVSRRTFASVHDDHPKTETDHDDGHGHGNDRAASAPFLKTAGPGDKEAPTPPPPPPPLRPIRERLRDFVADEPPALTRLFLRDAARVGRGGVTQNALTRVESGTEVEIDAGNGAALDDDGCGAGGTGGGDDDPNDLSWAGAGGGGGSSSSPTDPDDAVPSLTTPRPYGAVAPQAGDLLEVSTDSWRIQLLAVCLGNFRGVDHFYTNTGKWFVSAGVRSLFGVTRFASADELAPVIAALPAVATTDVSETVATAAGAGGDRGSSDALALDAILNTLQDLKLGPSREAGAGLIHKMNAFAEQSAAVYMAHAAVLDNAFKVVQKALSAPVSSPKTVAASASTSASPPAAPLVRNPAYMTLSDLAAILLRLQKQFGAHAHHGPPVRPSERGHGQDEFTPAAMYAVYRALMTDEIAFRPLSADVGGVSEAPDENNDDDNDDAVAVTRGGGQKGRVAAKGVPSHSRSCLFSVSSSEDVDVVHKVEHLARTFYEDPELVRLGGGRLPDAVLERSRLGTFVLKARKAIDRSRQTRSWSPYGMLGPILTTTSGQQQQQQQPRSSNQTWSASDMEILQFMHLWAGYRRFSPSSRLHWVGSAVLRALERYDASEYLAMSTGWTFLQEVGWVAPWDIPARYRMALPDVRPLRTGGFERALPPPSSSSSLSSSSSSPPSSSSSSLLADDLFAGHRKDWRAHGITAFAIDAPSATDIDDAISLEPCVDNDGGGGCPADSSDAFWIHVHVADPASCIRPGSPLAEQAAMLPQTAYLPGHFARMFPDDVVRERFSLAPGRPCLTFSAKVRRGDGTVVASAITPARLGDVVFITPEEVSKVVADAEAGALRQQQQQQQQQQQRQDDTTAAVAPDPPWMTPEFSVGTRPTDADSNNDAASPSPSPPPTRPMTTAAELTPDQRADLETLAVLATALRSVRLANGAMPLYWPRPAVEVSLAPTQVAVVNVDLDVDVKDAAKDALGTAAPASSYFLQCSGDPYIRIWYEGSQQDGDAASASAAAGSRLVESTMRLAGEVAADWCHARGRPPEAALRELRRLLGADDVTAVAVPHVTMGVARYTKATSPLRRYADLVAAAAVLADAPDGAAAADTATTTANAAASTTAGPPFTRTQLERDVLPLLRIRERALRTLDNRLGRDQWMLQALVRGWLGEAAGGGHNNDDTFLGRRLHFTVSRVDARRGVVAGRLNWFERAAVMELNTLNPVADEADKTDQTDQTNKRCDDGDSSFPRTLLRLDDVRPGQVYPVALAHVDVHGNRVLVRRVGECLPSSSSSL